MVRTSAKTGAGVEDAFTKLRRRWWRRETGALTCRKTSSGAWSRPWISSSSSAFRAERCSSWAIRPPPAWFVATFHSAGTKEPVTLLQAFPVLDAFMSEAEIFWEQNTDGRLEGEAFVVTGTSGENLPLAAIAVAMSGRRFLLLQRVAGFDDRQHILQRARERALEYEALVKRVDQLRRPVAALSKLAGELAEAASSGQQQAHVSGIAREAESLRKLVDELPRMPSGTSARGR